MSGAVVIIALAVACGLALALVAARLRFDPEPLVPRIDALLPQTQCAQCGYPGCAPYARAIARGEADINRCPPGGDATIRALARLLGRAPRPLDPARGAHKPRAVAFIDEATCIGCTLCIQACPVDAIVGAAKLMHTVIAAECTGCELCVPPCPVDCIEMRPATGEGMPWKWARPTVLAPAAPARR
jgi:electron transport complex protein RnfB